MSVQPGKPLGQGEHKIYLKVFIGMVGRKPPAILFLFAGLYRVDSTLVVNLFSVVLEC